MYSCKHMLVKSFLKGQFTLVALVMLLIMLIVFARMFPMIDTYLTTLIADLTAGGYTISALLMSLVPLLIAVAIITSIFWYMVPRRQ